MRPPALLPILLVTTACVTWQPATVAPEVLVTDQHPKSIRLTKVDGHRLVLQKPRLVADSIIGKDPAADRRRAVAVKDIGSIESGRTDTGKSLLLLLAVIAVGVAAVAALVGPGLN